MDINFTIAYKAYFDLDRAVQDFQEKLYWHPEADIDKVLYDVIEENVTWPTALDDLPNEVIEIAATALRKQIGGVQMQMDLPPFPTLWYEDSVWKN